MRVSLIVAMTPERLIGRGGGLPWRLPADLKRFQQLTLGHPLIMGRRTYESIGRPLPGRTSLVLTRGSFSPPPGVISVRSLEEALAVAATLVPAEGEAFVIGGGEVYALAMPHADRIYLTLVLGEPVPLQPGDTLFPSWDQGDWRLREESERAADERNPRPLRFLVYDRRRGETESFTSRDLETELK